MKQNWIPDLHASSKPKYLALADAIEADMRNGVLQAGERLPPQRELAQALDVDFTTVARGYAEARSRGLVSSQVGRGTFVRSVMRRDHAAVTADIGTLASTVDRSMNLPPEPEDPALLARLGGAFGRLAGELAPLLRYQNFGGSDRTLDAAASLIGRLGLAASRDRLSVTPGAHSALSAILSVLARPGDAILSEAVTYPGIRSISSQLGLELIGLEVDGDGVLPDALDAACRRGRPRALYLNPTIQNPTTTTMPADRRRDICDIARRHGLAIIEDDAYGFIPDDPVAPLATLAPELTWYIGGLSKWLGAGLRLALTLAPDGVRPWAFVGAMRTATGTASPITAALATCWIEDGTADRVLDFIRAETRARQQIASRRLADFDYRADPLSFNIWLRLGNGWSRANFTAHMRQTGLGLVASDAFTVSGTAEEAVRVGLGGPISRDGLDKALDFMAHALRQPPEVSAAFF